ncbi:MAG: class I SAM-dependent methyltransferase [Coriobacteriales bacterium]|jgi:SAM-dependent methyltransferase|nr:class I SAM-dependent methyltransferase [Coriobacteriales bacterium]
MQVTSSEYWCQAWLERERLRKETEQQAQPSESFAGQEVDYWDSRATDYAKHATKSPYATAFLDLLGRPEKKTILDFGAGTGTLAIPLAQANNKVIACDFSTRMLEELARWAQNEDIMLVAEVNALAAASLQRFASLGSTFDGGQIAPKRISWTDDWARVGIADKSVDIAVASRSTMVGDLGEAFDKLERAARERVAVTMSTEFRPHGFKMLGSGAHGSKATGGFVPDHILAMNILFFKGAYPELHYIDSYKSVEKEQAAEAVATGASAETGVAVATGVADATDAAPTTDTAAETAPELRLVRWAFITWEPVR